MNSKRNFIYTISAILVYSCSNLNSSETKLTVIPTIQPINSPTSHPSTNSIPSSTPSSSFKPVVTQTPQTINTPISENIECCSSNEKSIANISGRVKDKDDNILSGYSIKLEILEPEIKSNLVYYSDLVTDQDKLFFIRAILLEPKDKALCSLSIIKNDEILYQSEVIVYNGYFSSFLSYFEIKLK